ncbi:MAG: hypothetical protein AAFV29_26660, partial [Myxococcota bacterium]
LNIAFANFMLRQKREIGDARTQLSRGTPIDVLLARKALLNVELYAWRSPGARFIERVFIPIAILGLLAALWWIEIVPLFLSIGTALFYYGFCAWGYVRVPHIQRQLSRVDALLEELSQDAGL